MNYTTAVFLINKTVRAGAVGAAHCRGLAISQGPVNNPSRKRKS